MDNKITIGIPVRNEFHYLNKLLYSIDKYTDKNLIDKIIVIDDGSRQMLKLKTVDIIRNNVSLGFPASCNQIINNSSSDFICILNSDTFVSPMWLSLLADVLKSENVGIVGPSTSYANDPQCKRDICSKRHKMSENDIIMYSNKLRNEAGNPVDIGSVLTGFCMLIKRSVLSEVGTFDERFGLGSFEEADLCIRIMNARYKCMWVQKAYVHHYGKGTFGKMNWLKQWKENQKKFEEKWNF